MMIAPGRGWWFGGGGTRWLVANVTQPERPLFVGDYLLGESGSVSALSVQGGKVFASMARYDWVPAATNKTSTITVIPWWEQQGSWVSTHTLHVLDAADASEPVLRDPVLLPGELKGVSHGGSVLYSRVESNDAKGLTSVTLRALGYDGLSARRIVEREIDIGDSGIYLIQVAATTEEVEAQTWWFDLALAITFGVLAIALAGAAAMQVLFGLRPLRALQQEVSAIRQGERDRIEGSFPEDLAPLAGELNLLIASNREILERARGLDGKKPAAEPVAAATVEEPVAS
jgi:hypothetical protein